MKYNIPDAFRDFAAFSVSIPERPDMTVLYDIPGKRIYRNLAALQTAKVIQVRFSLNPVFRTRQAR